MDVSLPAKYEKLLASIVPSIPAPNIIYRSTFDNHDLNETEENASFRLNRVSRACIFFNDGHPFRTEFPYFPLDKITTKRY